MFLMAVMRETVLQLIRCDRLTQRANDTSCASLRCFAVADGGRVCDRCHRLPAAVQRLV